MQKAGYNPTASLTFFERLEAADKTRANILSHAFEDHPDTPARIAALDVELRQIGYDVPAPTTTPARLGPSPAPARSAPQPGSSTGPNEQNR
ncbi:MAG TPA: hypothetical protein VEP50_11505 [bacterium]|nr:hypothetical protein [bacterium]